MQKTFATENKTLLDSIQGLVHFWSISSFLYFFVPLHQFSNIYAIFHTFTSIFIHLCHFSYIYVNFQTFTPFFIHLRHCIHFIIVHTLVNFCSFLSYFMLIHLAFVIHLCNFLCISVIFDTFMSFHEFFIHFFSFHSFIHDLMYLHHLFHFVIFFKHFFIFKHLLFHFFD